MRYIQASLIALNTLFLACASESSASRPAPRVVLIRTPENGIQPQAAIDSKGNLHLIYFKGDPATGDIFYVRESKAAGNFSPPVRVNSQPGSAIATGTIRGAHTAIGKGDRVHVAWMGSKIAQSTEHAAPMLFARLNDTHTSFEPQRNVMQFATGLDGGGSVAADHFGNVYVVWHAGADVRGEANRRVWIARSRDDGKNFSREFGAYDEPTGVCGCCGMRAFADRLGRIYILYRAATAEVNRDMYLLMSAAGGEGFSGSRIHDWKINACPMSSASIVQSRAGVLLAWETAGQVYFAEVNPTTGKTSPPIPAPGEGGRRKHPSVAGNARGETILAWAEGTGWNRGGSLAWQVFDETGRPIGNKGEAPGLPVWSFPAAVARPEGGFAIMY